MSFKECPGCNTARPADEFTRAGKYGRRVARRFCNRCLADKQAERRDRDPDHVRGIQRRCYQRLREHALSFLGGECVRCGFTDPRALQIDHVNGGGTREHRTIGNSAVYRKVLAGEPGYQLLCANCNWIKRAENDENYSLSEPVNRLNV